MNRLSKQLQEALRVHLGGGAARPPEAGIVLWNIFNSISRTRTWHSHGPNPISYAEIEAYGRCMGVALPPRHVQILIDMDSVWIDDVHKHVKAPKGAKSLPMISKHPISAGLLDAIMG